MHRVSPKQNLTLLSSSNVSFKKATFSKTAFDSPKLSFRQASTNALQFTAVTRLFIFGSTAVSLMAMCSIAYCGETGEETGEWEWDEMGDTGRLCCRTEATSRDARGEMLRTPEIEERRDFGNLGDGGARITFESRFTRSLTTVSKIILATRKRQGSGKDIRRSGSVSATFCMLSNSPMLKSSVDPRTNRLFNKAWCFIRKRIFNLSVACRLHMQLVIPELIDNRQDLHR